MKFEFEKNYIPAPLIEDLGFDTFLLKLNLDLPIISKYILKPLTEEIAREQLLETARLESHTCDEQIRSLIEITQGLPNIDYLLNAFEGGVLEAPHLFTLMQFLKTHQELEALENNIFNNPAASFLAEREILKPFLDSSFNFLKRSSDEQDLISKSNGIDDQIANEAQELERSIFKQTTLKMFYPYPKELTGEITEAISGSELLKVEKTQNGYLVDFKLTPEMLQLQKEKEQIISQINAATELKLVNINDLLKPQFKDFSEKLNLRLRRIFLYALIFAKNVYKLSWPRFSSDKFSCVDSRHLLLEQYRKSEYSALSMNFSQGSTVIIGSNMSGKTSTLRNLYFITTLCKFGLPVPVRELELPFPSDTYYHVRSSGRPELNMSSFTEEVSFFEQSFKENSYVFIDELFQTTNPSSGVLLSEIFLKDFAAKKLFFVCSTHFLNLLSMTEVQFYKMSDQFRAFPLDSQRKSFNLQDEIKKPFELCLNYNLPLTIKNKIENWIKNSKH